jgi:hypothetical protein
MSGNESNRDVKREKCAPMADGMSAHNVHPIEIPTLPDGLTKFLFFSRRVSAKLLTYNLEG